MLYICLNFSGKRECRKLSGIFLVGILLTTSLPAKVTWVTDNKPSYLTLTQTPAFRSIYCVIAEARNDSSVYACRRVGLSVFCGTFNRGWTSNRVELVSVRCPNVGVGNWLRVTHCCGQFAYLLNNLIIQVQAAKKEIKIKKEIMK